MPAPTPRPTPLTVYLPFNRDCIRDGFVPAKTGDTPPPLVVARQELDGHIAFAAGKIDQSFRTLQAAVRAERALMYTEPPSYPRPVAEALGRKALEKGKSEIAEDAFRQELEQYPEAQRALSGLSSVRGPGF